MATFGQGVNPQFGAIDYSPIQRGAAVGAQLAAQGGQMIGQGLANLGQEVGKGIEKYAEQKKKNAARDGFIASSVRSMVTLSGTLQKAGNKEAADETASLATALEAEPDKDKAYAMAQNGLQNYATIHQLGQQALGEKQRKETAAYYNYLLNGQKTDIMDGGMGAPQASEQSIAAANEMLLNRRYKESQIAHQNAAAGGVRATTNVSETKRQAAIIAGKSLITGLPISKDTAPELYLAATDLITEAGSKQESLNALKKTASDHTQYATDALDDLANPRIETRGGDQVLVLRKLGGGFEYQKIASTEVQKIQEKAAATREILKQYHADGADENARFVAEAALLTLNPFLGQFGGIMGLSEILKNTKATTGETAAPATKISISSISPSTAKATPPEAPAASAVSLSPSNQAPGVLSPEFGAAAAQSAANNNPPAYRNGTPVGQSTGSPAVQNAPEPPPAPSGYGQDARGEQMPMVPPQVQTGRPVAPSATLTAGAANVVKSSVADKFDKVLSVANEAYIGGEIARSALMNEGVKAKVQAGARLAASKLEFLAKNLSKGPLGKIIPLATKYAPQIGPAALKAVRPALIANSIDIIIGKYLGADIPDRSKMRYSQALGESLALWSESESDQNRDKAVSLLLDKSSMLMKSNMSREQKIAKNAEYLRLMNIINEHQGQKVGAFQKYHDDQVAQFNNQFGR